MISLDLIFAIIPGIILFLYGIEQFSREFQVAAGEQFRALIQRFTSTPLRGTVAGAIVTALVQSSTATTVITVGLVNAGIISFAASLGIIIGSNIGTTFTTQLIALNLTAFAPVFILAGFLIGIVGGKYRVFGRPVFYFGLVFFSLSMISTIMEPYRFDPQLISLLSFLDNVFLEIAFGFLVTTIFQSSAVTTGLVIVLTQNGLVTPDLAIPILLGANLGTPTTSLLVAWRMNTAAKRAAMAHFLFNFLGVLIFLPFLGPFTDLVINLGGSPGQQVANAHLIFNISCAGIFLVAIRPFSYLVKKAVPGREDDIVFLPRFLKKPLPDDTDSAIEMIEKEIIHLLEIGGEMLRECNNLLDTPDAPFQRVQQLREYAHYLDDQIADAILEMSRRDLERGDAAYYAVLLRISSHGRVLADEAGDFSDILLQSRERGLEFSPDSILIQKDLLASCERNVGILRDAFPDMSDRVDAAMRSIDETLRVEITRHYHQHVIRISSGKSTASSTISRMLFHIEGMAATIRELRKSTRLLRMV
ncbi:MAG TPA: Na/Pi cotransporter family protein [Methanolinea sp.]|nr:Na/Pi cotransporter family protein [Methanolinea sp.]HQK55794.1 Na/Pi cotransporter family protein [Methanolinea sp.]